MILERQTFLKESLSPLTIPPVFIYIPRLKRRPCRIIFPQPFACLDGGQIGRNRLILPAQPVIDPPQPVRQLTPLLRPPKTRCADALQRPQRLLQIPSVRQQPRPQKRLIRPDPTPRLL